MNDVDIIDLYNKGFSISFISEMYFRFVQKEIRKGHRINGEYVILKSEYNKSKCLDIVYSVIYNYLMKKK